MFPMSLLMINPPAFLIFRWRFIFPPVLKRTAVMTSPLHNSLTGFVKNRRCTAILLLSLGLCHARHNATAEDYSTAPLTPEEQQAMSAIEQSEVLSTISFLASDELAGRDTPSPELNIAASYVASRFRGAGLEGLGPEGSFYQTHELIQHGPPAGTVVLKQGDRALDVIGAVFGGDEQRLIKASITSENSGAAVKGSIVLIDEPSLPPQAANNVSAATVTLARRVLPLVSQGAVAVLIRTGKDSPLPEALQLMRGRPLMLHPQLQVTLPVVLIPSETAVQGEVELTMPPRTVTASTVKNVVAILRGSDPQKSSEAILFSAHLDHIGRLAGDRDGDMINNGADDNATGVTAVVTLADAYAALTQKPARSVIFMTFWGEEKGLLGSRYYCENPLWPLEKTVANINIEMIGRPETGAEEKMWGTGWTRSSLGQQMAAGASRAGVEVFHREDVSEMLYTRSDNYSFVQKGVIAHSFSAGSLHSDYHQPTDEYTRLNIAHMSRIIEGLFAGSLPLAKGELTPAAVEK